MFGAAAFGTPASSTFGQTTNTLFGATPKPSTNVFGQPSGLGGGSSLFGTPAQTGSVAWGASAGTTVGIGSGTPIAFQPPYLSDTQQRGSQTTQVNAKHMCITTMKEYQDKSLEELRAEDYAAGRQNGPNAATATASSLFSASAAVKPFQFGAAQTTSTTNTMFGQAKPGNTLFGSTSTSTQPIFGQQTQSQGLLGVAQPNSLFGTPASTQSTGFGFGQTNQSSLFGAKPLFGGASSTSTAGTGLFGASQPAAATSSVFGFGQAQTQQQPAVLGGTTNLFGQPAATAATGLFGTQPTVASVAPFGSAATNLFGAAKTTAGGSSFFGSSTAFSGQPQQQATGFGFGTQPASGTTTGLFGAPAASGTTGLFGATTTNTGGFGFGAAQGSTLGVFGAATAGNTTGLFGQSTPKKAFELGSTFGNPAASSASGLFGQTNPSGGLFGTSSAAPALGFGTAAAASGASGFMLGQQNTPFGIGQKPAGSGFSFGGGAGLATGSTGLFGASGSSALGGVAQPLGSAFGGFGQPGQTGSSLVGSVNNMAEQLAQSVRVQQQVLELVRSMPYGQSPLFRYLNMSTNDSTVEVKPGSLASGTGSTPATTASSNVVPAKAAANALVERQKAAGLSFGPGSPCALLSPNRTVRPTRQSATVGRPLSVTSRSKLFSGFYEDDAFESPSDTRRSPALWLRRSATLGADNSLLDSPAAVNKSGFFTRRDEWKRLQLPESVRTSILEKSIASSKELSHLAEASLLEDSESVQGPGAVHVFDSPAGDAVNCPSTASNQQPVQITSTVNSSTPLITAQSTNTSGRTSAHAGFRSRPLRVVSENSTLSDESDQSHRSPPATPNDPDRSSRSSSQPHSPSVTALSKSNRAESEAPSGLVRLTKSGYYTLPMIDELNSITGRDGRCVIEDFVVGRRNYGHILFPGLTDVTGLNLDEIVHIRRREVVVYPDDANKPPVGSGLNKRAEICLESVWPPDKSTHGPVKSPDRLARFEQRLEKSLRLMDARFIEYRSESGSLVFEVKHFSKYRLDDSDNDEDEEGPTTEAPPTTAVPITHIHTQAQADSLIAQSAPYHKARTNLLNRTSNQSNSPESEPKLMHSFRSELTTDSQMSIVAAQTPSLTVRQMRDAFFRPRHTIHKQSIFQQPGEFGDEESDLEDVGYSYPKGEPDFAFKLPESQSLNWPIVGSKRVSPDDFTHTTPLSFSKQDTFAASPIPEKVPRPKVVPPAAHPKWEEISDEGDSPVDYAKRETPFRPIFAAKISEGVPLDSTCAPPATAQLHLARVPTELKCARGDYQKDGMVLIPELYPYSHLLRLLKTYQDRKTEHFAPTSLSSLLLDAGLWRGHGMRPSWGHTRTVELHAAVLVTLGPSPTRTHCSGRSLPAITDPTFPVRISCQSAFIEHTDESLLNAALLTSNRCSEWTDNSSQPHPTLWSAPTDHCPLWRPELGLAPLEAYAKVLLCDYSDPPSLPDTHAFSPRILIVRRLVALCLALWGRHHALQPLQGRIQQEHGEPGYRTELAEGDSGSDVYLTDKDHVSADSPDSYSDSNTIPDDDEPVPLRMLARKQALSEWIRSHSSSWLESRLVSLKLFDICCKVEPNTRISARIPRSELNVDRIGEALLACLLAGEPGAACRLALAASMPGLASLIAQSSASDPLVRRGLRQQLLVWHETEYDQRIPLVMLRIYALLAGQEWFPHPKLQKSRVCVLQGVDWIRVLGAYLWYICPYEADLPTVLDTYGSRWCGRKSNHPTSENELARSLVIARPIPPNQHDLLCPPPTCNAPVDFPDLDNTSTVTYWPRDCAYHLLSLYCRKSHSLEHTLDPCSMSIHSLDNNPRAPSCKPDPTALSDWAPSWTVWRVLHALNYRHLASDNTQSRLCIEFAAQLEDGGLWEWAVFVLLHLTNQNVRDAAVKSCVSRHVCLVLPESNTISDLVCKDVDLSNLLDSIPLAPPPPFTKAEQFVVELGVPVRWIHEAKAVLARRQFAGCKQQSEELKTFAGLSGPFLNSQSHHEVLRARLFALLEASHWFAAGHYSASHDVCLNYLLPNLVLHTDLSIVCSGMTNNHGTSSIGLLAGRLDPILQPFAELSPACLPSAFDTGVGIYVKFAELLRLADHLSQLCHSSANGATHSESSGSEGDALVSTLRRLQTDLDGFVEQLQFMQTPNPIASVVKTELAATCIQMLSGFLVANLPSGTDADGQNANLLTRLQHQLHTMIKLRLPADHRLRELSALCDTQLSMGIV